MNENLFNTITWLWIILALLVFISLQFKKAPYGRYSSEIKSPSISNRWGWVLMELPALLVCPLMYFFSSEKSLMATLLIGLWTLHYVHRTLVFPFQIQTKGKTMPIAIVCMAFVFNCCNGWLNGYWVANFSNHLFDHFSSLGYYIGIGLFVTGAIINLRSDYYLISIRKSGEKRYVIPQKGLFKYITCSNYFGEIIEWLGFAVAMSSIAGWSFFIWTLANLIPRAKSHHKWYQDKFEHYPEKRKAIIPFIY